MSLGRFRVETLTFAGDMGKYGNGEKKRVVLDRK